MLHGHGQAAQKMKTKSPVTLAFRIKIAAKQFLSGFIRRVRQNTGFLLRSRGLRARLRPAPWRYDTAMV
jgi:hypothetical protein